MFNLRLGNAATIRYSQLKFGLMHLCVTAYTYIFHHTVASVIVLAVLPQYDVVMHATGPVAIASIQFASTANSIQRG